jgi:hypothetical protein
MTATVPGKKAGSVGAAQSPITGLRRGNIRTALSIVQGNSGLFQGNTVAVRKIGSMAPVAPLAPGRMGNNGIGNIVRMEETGPIGREGISTPRAGSGGPARETQGPVDFVPAKV